MHRTRIEHVQSGQETLLLRTPVAGAARCTNQCGIPPSHLDAYLFSDPHTCRNLGTFIGKRWCFGIGSLQGDNEGGECTFCGGGTCRNMDGPLLTVANCAVPHISSYKLDW